MAQWTDPSRTFLISEIRTRSIVWDRDVSNDSTHKIAKQKAFTEVAKALNEAFPSISSKFTGEDVRSQWKNLKDTFVRKLRYLHEGKYAYDSQKEPTWKFYRMLSFLDDKKKERLSPENSLFDISSLHRDHRSFSIDLPKAEPFENSNESASSQEVLQILADQLKNDKNENSLCSLNPGSPNQSGDSNSGLSTTCLKTDSPKTPTGGESVEEEEEPRKKKTCQRCVRNVTSTTNDEFDLFGSLVAAQLRRLAEENSRSCSLRLQKALNDIMYESQMDLLGKQFSGCRSSEGGTQNPDTSRMGKKSFFNKKNTVSFSLVPNSSVQEETTEPEFKRTAEQLGEQHKYGVFFDDDYDYMKHLKSRDETYSLQFKDTSDVKKEATKLPTVPRENFSFMAERSLHETQKGVYDEEVDHLLEGNFKGNQGVLEDDFIALAGGVAGVPNAISSFRVRKSDDEDSDDEFDEKHAFDDEYDEDEDEEEDEIRDGPQRDIDDAFDRMLEADYNEDQLGELDGDDEMVAGLLEPDNGRLRRLTTEKISDPEYDEQMAKEYVKKRYALIEAGVIKEDAEMVEVEESPSKRLKWDCESFASQYSNLYNHPTIIKDPNQVLSRKALKRFNRENAKKDAVSEEDEEDMDYEDDNLSQCTSVSTIRPKGETPEERNLRKKAVKAARRARIVERKQNQAAFADAHKKMTQSRFGQIKYRPVK